MRHLPRRYLITILFVIVMAAMYVSLFRTTQSQHDNSVQACQRGNDLRHIVNENNSTLRSKGITGITDLKIVDCAAAYR